VFFVATDRVITCADCGQSFTFTASEQQFYSDRGYSDPRRCSSCRAQRKSERSGQSGGYGAGGSSYSGGTSYGGGSSSYGTGFGNGGGGYRGDRPQREMFEATCSACGKTARVPFRPSSGKPVYCNDCFALRRA
jgi:CxxC-x17-CxxC domain-containing protein